MPETTEQQKALQARIAELKTYEGKTFKRKDGTGPQSVTIVKYAGIGVRDGVSSHAFLVESKNPGARWTPQATQFLAEHNEVPAAEIKSTEQEVL